MSNAEEHIRQNSALYRHYRIDEVQCSVKQFTGEALTDDQIVALVQNIRDEQAMGPIADYNMPGYVEDETPRHARPRREFW